MGTQDDDSTQEHGDLDGPEEFSWLGGQPLMLRTWSSSLGTPDDHDRCWFCSATIGPPEFEPGSLERAYLLEEHGTWICPSCATSKQPMFNWTLDEEPGTNRDA